MPFIWPIDILNLQLWQFLAVVKVKGFLNHRVTASPMNLYGLLMCSTISYSNSCLYIVKVKGFLNLDHHLKLFFWYMYILNQWTVSYSYSWLYIVKEKVLMNLDQHFKIFLWYIYILKTSTVSYSSFLAVYSESEWISESTPAHPNYFYGLFISILNHQL